MSQSVTFRFWNFCQFLRVSVSVSESLFSEKKSQFQNIWSLKNAWLRNIWYWKRMKQNGKKDYGGVFKKVQKQLSQQICISKRTIWDCCHCEKHLLPVLCFFLLILFGFDVFRFLGSYISFIQKYLIWQRNDFPKLTSLIW